MSRWTGPLTERACYLLTTILACCNCLAPKTEAGAASGERNLAGGGLSFTTPAFSATAANIAPDRETGIHLGQTGNPAASE